jgi:hypothetical protein
MKQRQWMQLLPFLKRSLKRNKWGKYLFLILLQNFFLFNSAAISVDMKIKTDSCMTIFQNIQESNKESLLKSLNQGHQSEILIQVRLYKKRSQIYSLLGDELIDSLEINKKAKIDIFSNTYALSNNELTSYFDKESDFLEHYLNSEILIPLENVEMNKTSSYYIKTKTTLIKKLYLKPFNIFYLFDLKNRISTGWLRNEI